MTESERHELEDRLTAVLAEIEKLRVENDQLRDLVSQRPISQPTLEQPGAALEGPRLEAQSSEEAKVRLFRDLFRGREDVYAYRWEGRDGRSGYSPALRPGASRQKGERPDPELLLPLDDDVIRGHLLGRRVVGVYPLLEDETCWFLAIDFDKATWQIDVVEVIRSCRELGVPTSLERSRSGRGAHLWIFFEKPVSSHTARNLGCAILTDALERRHQIGFESYDRLFPSQDTMPRGGFGNLIALPLQRLARSAGNTVFLDDDFQPHEDQWRYLSSVRRLPLADCELHDRYSRNYSHCDECSRPEAAIGERTAQACVLTRTVANGSRPPDAVKVKRRSLPRKVSQTTVGGLRREQEVTAQRRLGGGHR